MNIKKIDGKWVLNGKPYRKLAGEEKIFFEKFIVMMKGEKEIESEKIREVQDRAADRIVMQIQNHQFVKTLASI